MQFADSVRHITGQNLEATVASEGRDADLREELEILRSRLDELTEEVSNYLGLNGDPLTSVGQCKRLQDEVLNQAAELNILRALPSNVHSKTPTKAGEVRTVCHSTCISLPFFS